MRKIIVFEHLSLDGVVQAPSGKNEDMSNDFEQGDGLLHFSILRSVRSSVDGCKRIAPCYSVTRLTSNGRVTGHSMQISGQLPIVP